MKGFTPLEIFKRKNLINFFASRRIAKNKFISENQTQDPKLNHHRFLMGFTLLELLIVAPIRKLRSSFLRAPLEMRFLTGRGRSASPKEASFTLLELLIVIGILAILATIIILVLNPAELLRQGRDTQRISDLANVNKTLSFLQADQPGVSLGTASTTYLSLPDTDDANPADCDEYSLPSLPSGWSYYCALKSSYRKTDGTGWIPVNLTTLFATGSPLSNLPIDPVNTAANGLYYTYTVGGSWELTAMLEAQKNKLGGNQDQVSKDGGDSYELYEVGSSLTLSPINDQGLIGYWKFDEGSGATVEDASGNSNTGTWNGGGTRWTTGKAGSAGQFNGTNDYVGVAASASIQGVSSYTVAVWLSMELPGTNYNPIFLKESGIDVWDIEIENSGTGASDRIDFVHNYGNGGTLSYGEAYTNPAISANVWTHVTVTYGGGELKVYINGALLRTFAGVTDPLTNNFPVDIGRMLYSGGYRKFFLGKMDDMRLYNRALSAAEIKAIYDGTK